MVEPGEDVMLTVWAMVRISPGIYGEDHRVPKGSARKPFFAPTQFLKAGALGTIDQW